MASRSRGVGLLAVVLALSSSAPSAPAQAAPALPARCDVRIDHGRVVDGSGAPAREATVLVVGDRIAAVVDDPDAAAAVEAGTVVDAAGMVVTPGFVDLHAHGDPRRTPEFGNFLAMGVTTIFLGLDGSSPWRDGAGAWFDEVAARRPAVHVGAFVGHGSVRRAVLGDAIDRPADAEERGEMARRIAAALDAGAYGLSTGLEYVPGRYADAPELEAVARPVGERGLVVASHVRNEDRGAVGAAVQELLDQCRATGAAAHVSHVKIVYAQEPTQAEELLEALDRARAGGIRATADLYPYTASYTGLSILFPDWALPPHDYAEVVGQRRDALRAHLERRVLSRNGPEATLFGSGPYAGRTLAEVAEERDESFADVLVGLGPRGASAAYFVMGSRVVERLLQDPHVVVASDGSPTMRHPRGHGTFAKILREFVRERGVLTLEEAVAKMSRRPAEIVGLGDRGRVEPGAVADLLVFDPERVEDHATFTDPYRRATGIAHVLVAGRFAVRDGEPTGIRAGRVLRREAGGVSGAGGSGRAPGRSPGSGVTRRAPRRPRRR